ncbi:transporter [Candidatus Omnitrophota bacterium]
MKRVFLFNIIVAALFMLNCRIAYAVRPLSTEDASVVGRGTGEAEIGFEYARQDNRDDNYAVIFMPIYGITEYMQVSIELPLDIKSHKDEPTLAGLGDITLSLKTLLAPEKGNVPSFSLKTDFKIANGNEEKGFGSGDTDIGFILSATKTFSLITMYGSIGYVFVGDKEKDVFNDAILYGIALEYALTSKLNIVSEIYGEGDLVFVTGAFEEHAINPLVGLNYRIKENIILDTAFKMGISRDKKTEYGIIGGTTISF